MKSITTWMCPGSRVGLSLSPQPPPKVRYISGCGNRRTGGATGTRCEYSVLRRARRSQSDILGNGLVSRDGPRVAVSERPPVQERWQEQQRDNKAVHQTEHQQNAQPRVGGHLRE